MQIAAKICVAQSAVIEHLQEAFWPAAKLDIWLAVLVDGRHVKAVPGLDKVILGIGKPSKIRLAALKSGVVLCEFRNVPALP